MSKSIQLSWQVLGSVILLGLCQKASFAEGNPKSVLMPIRMATAKVRILKRTGPFVKVNEGVEGSQVKEVCSFTGPVGVYSESGPILGGAPLLPSCKVDLNHTPVTIKVTARIGFHETAHKKVKEFYTSFKTIQEHSGEADIHLGSNNVTSDNLGLSNLSLKIPDEARMSPIAINENAFFLEVYVELNDSMSNSQSL